MIHSGQKPLFACAGVWTVVDSLAPPLVKDLDQPLSLEVLPELFYRSETRAPDLSFPGNVMGSTFCDEALLLGPVARTKWRTCESELLQSGSRPGVRGRTASNGTHLPVNRSDGEGQSCLIEGYQNLEQAKLKQFVQLRGRKDQ